MLQMGLRVIISQGACPAWIINVLWLEANIISERVGRVWFIEGVTWWGLGLHKLEAFLSIPRRTVSRRGWQMESVLFHISDSTSAAGEGTTTFLEDLWSWQLWWNIFMERFAFIALQVASQYLSMLTKAKMLWKTVCTEWGEIMRTSKPAAVNKVKASLEHTCGDILPGTYVYQWKCKSCRVNNPEITKLRQSSSEKANQNLQATLLVTALDVCDIALCYLSQAMTVACTV